MSENCIRSRPERTVGCFDCAAQAALTSRYSSATTCSGQVTDDRSTLSVSSRDSATALCTQIWEVTGLDPPFIETVPTRITLGPCQTFATNIMDGQRHVPSLSYSTITDKSAGLKSSKADFYFLECEHFHYLLSITNHLSNELICGFILMIFILIV